MGKQLKVPKIDLDVADSPQRLGFPYDDGLGNLVFELDSHNKIKNSEFAVFLMRRATVKFIADHGRNSDYPVTTLLGDHTEAWKEYLNKEAEPHSQLDRYIRRDLSTLLDEDLYRLPFRPNLASLIDEDPKIFEKVRDVFNQNGLTKSYSVRLKKLEALGFDSNAALRFAAESTLFLLENEITKSTPSHLRKSLYALQNIVGPENVALRERFAKAGLKSIAEVLSTRKQNTPAQNDLYRMIPDLITIIPESERNEVFTDLRMHILNHFGYDEEALGFTNEVCSALEKAFEESFENRDLAQPSETRQSDNTKARGPVTRKDLQDIVEEMLAHVDIKTYTRDVVLPSLASEEDNSTFYIDLFFTDIARSYKDGVSYIGSVLSSVNNLNDANQFSTAYKKIVEGILLDPEAFRLNIKLQAEFIDYAPWQVTRELVEHDCIDLEIAGRLMANRIDSDLRDEISTITTKSEILAATKDLMKEEFRSGITKIDFSSGKPAVKSKPENTPSKAKEASAPVITEPQLPLR